MSTTATPADLSRALSALRKHLEYLREEGVTEVEVSPATLKALKLRGRGAAAAPAAPPRAPARPTAPPPPPAPPKSVPPPVAPRAAATDAVSVELAGIAREIAACRACRLCEQRNNVVPGQGHTQPDIMFIGEGPGADEDEQGLAFVGRAGQLLTQIIEGMGFKRDQVFIGNVVKCRPPDNRKPEPDEMAACLPFLERQIAALKPKLIVTLGATAYTGLFKVEDVAITRERGKWMEFNGIPVMPTLHPSYLLRNPANAKRDVWNDMKAVLAKLGRPVPSRG
jgi:uracil-DNA glycosylase family 4